MSKWFIPVLAVIILAVSVPYFVNSCTAFQTDDYEYSQANVTTAAGVTTANVTLPVALFEDKLTNVNSATSNVTGESSVTPTVYNSTTYVLTVSGLSPSSTRTVTVDYRIDALTGNNTAVGTLASFWPLWLVLGGGLFVGTRVFRR